MLKKGDLIICDGSRRADGRSSWWIMSRDEIPEDRNYSNDNAYIVSRPVLSGFEDHPFSSWDSTILHAESAVVIPADEWTDEHYAQIAKWALLDN
jgi:hypothetical protein